MLPARRNPNRCLITPLSLAVASALIAVAAPALARTFVTDTVPPFRLPPDLLGARVEVVSAAPLFAEAIRRLHAGGSISDLLERGG